MDVSQITPGMSILGEDHLAQINRGIEIAQEGLRQIDIAARAGIDLSGEKPGLQDQLNKLLAMKQVYFPGR